MGENESRWVCSHKINNGKDSCPSIAVLESEIRPILFKVFQEAENDVDRIIDDYRTAFIEMTKDNNIEKQIQNTTYYPHLLGNALLYI